MIWKIIFNKEVRELFTEIYKALKDWKITKEEKDKIFKEALDVVKQWIGTKKKLWSDNE